METSYRPIASIGLRHVVEDTLALINNDCASTERERQVVSNMQTFLQKALRGAEMTSIGHHSVQVGDINALETYTKLFDYFNTQQDHLAAVVSGTLNTLSSLSAGTHLDYTERQNASNFLHGLLEKLYTEECFQLQSEPENIFLR